MILNWIELRRFQRTNWRNRLQILTKVTCKYLKVLNIENHLTKYPRRLLNHQNLVLNLNVRSYLIFANYFELLNIVFSFRKHDPWKFNHLWKVIREFEKRFQLFCNNHSLWVYDCPIKINSLFPIFVSISKKDYRNKYDLD